MKIEIELTEEDRDDIATKVAQKLQNLNIGQDKTYTVKELASKLKCHKNTVLNYIKLKLLKASQNGKKYIVTQKALDEFLKR